MMQLQHIMCIYVVMYMFTQRKNYAFLCDKIVLTLDNLYEFWTGNICRSPMAEAIFRNKVKKRGLTEQVNVIFIVIFIYFIL